MYHLPNRGSADSLKNACSGTLSEARRMVAAHMRDLRNTTILTTTTRHSGRRIMGRILITQNVLVDDSQDQIRPMLERCTCATAI